MFTVFNDQTIQKQFDKKGYMILPSLVNEVGIGLLTDVFLRFQGQCVGPFHTSHFSSDVIYKKETHDAIIDIVFPKLAPYLNNFAPLFGNFMIKNPDPNVTLDLHADWAYVDELKFRSVSVWIPLIDVNEKNGCLGVIEGSHKVTNSIRGPLIRQSTRNHESEWEKRYGHLLNMNAGDAIIYDHALLHYSHANKTDIVRPAINLSLAPDKAQWIHYCQPEGATEIELYYVDNADFYIRYDHFQRPEKGSIKDKLSPQMVQYIDGKMNNFWKTRIINGIKEFFKL